MAIAALVACDTPPAGYPGQILTRFDGNKQLILVATYSSNAAAIGIRAWAEVDPGTRGTIEMTGPWHLRCTGAFDAPNPKDAYPENLPSLDIGSGWDGATIHAPAGHYTAVVAIPEKNATIKKSFGAQLSETNPFTGTYDPPGLCVLVADTRQQLDDLTSQHVHAVDVWVGRMATSQLKTQLAPLSAEAYVAVQAGDRTAALATMTSIKDLIEPVKDKDYDLYRDIRVSLELLTQPVPAG